MNKVFQGVRRDERGGAGLILLALALALVAGLGFFVVLTNDYVTVEARLQNPNWSADPVTAQLDVRITNKYSGDLVVEQFTMTVWADQARTVQLSTASIAGVVIPSHQQQTFSRTIEIHNGDAFVGKVWVDVDATWTHGAENHHEGAVGKEISVGAALANLG